MSENKLVIRKHSAMIQINVKELTLTQRKIINCLICIAQKTGKQESYTTTISNLKEMCKIGKTDNLDLKQQLKKLKRIDIEFNYLNKDKKDVWELVSLLSQVKIVPNEGEVSFAFPPSLMDKIIKPRIYAPIDLILISGLKSTYAIILYEFLRDYLTAAAVPTISIDEIRDLLGIKENEYKLFQNLKAKALDVAILEINKKTDINCHYELIKERGNKNSHIQLFVTKKASNITYESNENIDCSMDLFENVAVQVNKPVVQIPEDIMSAVPDSQRTEALKDLLSRFLEKGNEYVISNIKYSLKHFTENFSGYLKVALENDYARNDREIKAKSKEAAVKKSRQIEQNEKAKWATYNDHAEILKKIESLAPDKLEPLHKKCDEIVMKSGIKPEFLTDTVKESLMIEAYRALHVVNAYSAPDQD